MGCHYTKNIPAQGHPYEQILVRYTSEELQRILLHLNIAYKLNITNNHQCDDCRTLNHATMPGWSSIRRFFQPHRRLPHGRIAPGRPDRRKPQNDRTCST